MKHFIEDRYIHRSTDVAKYIISMANKKKICMNMTKVQKLMYLVYGSYLVASGKRLIDEKAHAWPYGPVFPISREKLLGLDFLDINEMWVSKEILDDELLVNAVDFILDKFGVWSGGQLSTWSQESGSPWALCVGRRGFEWGDVIGDYDIYSYFNRIIQFKR